MGIVLWHNTSRAQENYTAYIQPQLTLNYKVAPYYKHNLSLSSRNFAVQNEDIQFQGRHLDLSHFSTFETGVGTSLGAGLMYRFRKAFDSSRDNEVRFTQQFSFTLHPLIVRYGHRLRVEQRFLPGHTIHRFRYRFSLDFPLEGEKVDLKEGYLILNTEALMSVSEGITPQFDQRLTLAIGWFLTDTIQIQTGLEHRWENYTEKTQPIVFLTSSCIFSL